LNNSLFDRLPDRLVLQQQQQQIVKSEYEKELVVLAKLYTENMTYNGENDNFDYKLIIFYNFCSKACVPEKTLI
jgi:hypothetical protein